MDLQGFTLGYGKLYSSAKVKIYYKKRVEQKLIFARQIISLIKINVCMLGEETWLPNQHGWSTIVQGVAGLNLDKV